MSIASAVRCQVMALMRQVQYVIPNSALISLQGYCCKGAYPNPNHIILLTLKDMGRF